MFVAKVGGEGGRCSRCGVVNKNFRACAAFPHHVRTCSGPAGTKNNQQFTGTVIKRQTIVGKTELVKDVSVRVSSFYLGNKE